MRARGNSLESGVSGWQRKWVVDPVVELLAFAGIMALGQFSPGPDMLLLTRTALADGVRAGVGTALGIATGLCLYSALAVGGAVTLLEQVPTVRQVMLWLAALYLLWLACRLIGACYAAYAGSRENEERVVKLKGSPYLRGLLCNLLNPKAVIFLAAVVAPFLKGNHPSWWPWALWLVVVIQAFVLWSLWATLLQWKPLRNGYQKFQPIIDGLFGLGLGMLAVKLVWK